MKLCSLAFHNGRIVPLQYATVPVSNHAFNFGTGVFESIRIYKIKNKLVCRGLDKHLKRLKNSVFSVGLSPVSLDEIKTALYQFIATNSLEEGYCRIIVYPEATSAVLDTQSSNTTFSIIGWHLASNDFLPPIKLDIAFLNRPNTSSTLPRAKVCGLYVIDSVVQNNAKHSGYDTGLLLNTDGTVCEASGANIFMISDNVLYTPSVNNSIHGITAEFITAIAAYENIQVIVKSMTVDDLFAADEVFITGTFYGIRPVSDIGKCNLPHAPGPLTSKLMNSFKNILSDQMMSLHQKWFHTLTKRGAKSSQAVGLLNVVIRAATSEDADFLEKALNQLIKELRDSDQLEKLGNIDCIREICENLNNSDQFKIFIAVLENREKIGFITVSIQNSLHCGKYGTIQELWVAEYYRSKKIGEDLISHVETYCREINIKRIDVGLPDYAFSGFEKTAQFYERNNYQFIGPRAKKVL